MSSTAGKTYCHASEENTALIPIYIYVSIYNIYIIYIKVYGSEWESGVIKDGVFERCVFQVCETINCQDRSSYSSTSTRDTCAADIEVLLPGAENT